MPRNRQPRHWRQKRSETREVVHVQTNSVERIPQSEIDRIARLERLWDSFEGSPQHIVPRALQEIMDRIGALERGGHPRDITQVSEILERVQRLESISDALDDHNSVAPELIERMADVLSNLATIVSNMQELKSSVRSLEAADLDARLSALEVFSGKIGRAAENTVNRRRK